MNLTSTRRKEGKDKIKMDLTFTSSAGVMRRRITHQQRRMKHRLLSIAHDASFVRFVAEHHQLRLPVYANVRCGSWYAGASGLLSGEACFKSTDGHANTWNFSLRRLNLHLLEIASSSEHGVLLVDATKRGRRHPDAFSRTVPIWCTVLNRTVARYRKKTGRTVEDWDVELHVPPREVSDVEKQIVTKKLDTLVDSFVDSGAVDLEWLSEKLGDRPLRAFWISTESHLVEGLLPDYTCSGRYVPIVCLSASEPLEDTEFRTFIFSTAERSKEEEEEEDDEERDDDDDEERDEKEDDNSEKRTRKSKSKSKSKSNQMVEVVEDVGYFYIPGAGDDHEKWSCGLTPELMRLNMSHLLHAAKKSDEAVESLIQDIVAAAYCAANDGEEEVFHPYHHSGGGDVTGGGGGGDKIPKRLSGHLRSTNFQPLGATNVFVGTRRAGRPPDCWSNFDAVVAVILEEYDSMKLENVDTKSDDDDDNDENNTKLPRYLHLPVPEGKRDTKNKMTLYLPRALCFILLHLAAGHRVLIHCNQGVDRSVGVAIAACSLYVERKGHTLLSIHEWCRGATLKSLGAERMRLLLFSTTARRFSSGGGDGDGGDGGGGGGGGNDENESEIVPMLPRLALLEWLDELRSEWSSRKEEEEEKGKDAKSDENSKKMGEDLPDKRDLRGALVAVAKYRLVASPSRYTMRKLSRFFTEKNRRKIARGKI